MDEGMRRNVSDFYGIDTSRIHNEKFFVVTTIQRLQNRKDLSEATRRNVLAKLFINHDRYCPDMRSLISLLRLNRSNIEHDMIQIVQNELALLMKHYFALSFRFVLTFSHQDFVYVFGNSPPHAEELFNLRNEILLHKISELDVYRVFQQFSLLQFINLFGDFGRRVFKERNQAGVFFMKDLFDSYCDFGGLDHFELIFGKEMGVKMFEERNRLFLEKIGRSKSFRNRYIILEKDYLVKTFGKKLFGIIDRYRIKGLRLVVRNIRDSLLSVRNDIEKRMEEIEDDRKKRLEKAQHLEYCRVKKEINQNEEEECEGEDDDDNFRQSLRERDQQSRNNRTSDSNDRNFHLDFPQDE